jgi:hypothetical protein
MVESSLVSYEDSIIVANRGGPASVEFDFDAVWAFTRKVKDFDPRYLVWLHVHPIGFGPQASAKDLECYRGLRIAFGETAGEFGILCFDNEELNEISGKICWHDYQSSQGILFPSLSMSIRSALAPDDRDLLARLKSNCPGMRRRYVFEEEVLLLKLLAVTNT